MTRIGHHRPGTWGADNVITCDCAACGVELLSPRCRTLHLPREARLLDYVFMRMADTERPLANHRRPYCRACATATRELHADEMAWRD